TPNYLVTAPSVEGPWSDPLPLHAQGFDPSLFHHDDGRSWLLSNRTDWRPGNPWANGIIAQEYDRAARRLVGEPVTIYTGTPAPPAGSSPTPPPPPRAPRRACPGARPCPAATAGPTSSPPRAARTGSTRRPSRAPGTCSAPTRPTRVRR